MTITPDTLREIEEKAKAATPGDWHWVIEDYSMATLGVGMDPGLGDPHVLSVSPCRGCIERAEPKEWEWGRCLTPSEADAAHIARMDPPTTLALVARIRELEGALDDLRDEAESFLDGFEGEVERLQAKIDRWSIAEHALSTAYVRLRTKIPGALDTPHAPSAAQIWNTTEAALDRLIARAEKAEAQLAFPLAGEVEEVASEISRLAVNTDNPHEAEYFDRIAARLRRFGRVPKLESTKEERNRVINYMTAMDPEHAAMIGRFIRDYDTLLSRISTDGATEVENG